MATSLARMVGQPRIEHPGDSGCSTREFGHAGRVRAVALHPQLECLEPPHRQIGIKGTGNRTRAVLQERKLASSSSSSVINAPPITSEWPPMYLVVECKTMSAPRFSGR